MVSNGESYESIKPYKSGLYAKNDAKDIIMSSNKKNLIIANNNEEVDVFSLDD